ncbi:MAG: AAA family ATPase, partial [Spirochaetota bacterium]
NVRSYLKDFEEDVIDNLFLFTKDQYSDTDRSIQRFIRYGVNIIVDNSDTLPIPIVFENHPTYANLVGSIETHFEIGGESRTSFMMIKAGSIIRSSGGFIVIRAEDILKEAESWYHLKRIIQTGLVEIQQKHGPLNLTGILLKPEPVEVDIKVVMVGNEHLYDILYNQDPDFQKHFKISAEFDSVMLKTPDTIAQYISFMKKLVSDEKMRELTPDGMCATIEYGVRFAEWKDKLTTRFSRVADIIREADYWAGKSGKEQIDREAVIRTIEERNYLFNLSEEKLDDLIVHGILLIKVTGTATGKVNGLAIHDRGYYIFGKPTLVTARTAPGDRGVVNIEREAGLSGELHDKGVMILEGYLRSKYALSFPLSVYASICFEQSYNEIEGDSASSTEMYALLSSIAGVPMRQDLAVSGSINQAGEIQPVGSITEKVEGFFRVCKKVGLTKAQGVLIPHQNIDNLIVSQEVCRAVEEGFFHIYPIGTIDEGLEILTGLEAGNRDSKDQFPENSLNYLIEKKLKEMANSVKAYGKG